MSENCDLLVQHSVLQGWLLNECRLGIVKATIDKYISLSKEGCWDQMNYFLPSEELFGSPEWLWTHVHDELNNLWWKIDIMCGRVPISVFSGLK